MIRFFANARRFWPMRRDGAFVDGTIGWSQCHFPVDREIHFSGGYIPALSEVLPAIERAGLLVTDIEILRLHYADTLRRGRRGFWLIERASRIFTTSASFVCGSSTLLASEMAFRKQAMMVFQIQLVKRQGIVPTTRDYIEREICATSSVRKSPSGAIEIGCRVVLQNIKSTSRWPTANAVVKSYEPDRRIAQIQLRCVSAWNEVPRFEVIGINRDLGTDPHWLPFYESREPRLSGPRRRDPQARRSGKPRRRCRTWCKRRAWLRHGWSGLRQSGIVHEEPTGCSQIGIQAD